MKKKLMSIIALALAMTMTTSAFAAISPRERGTADVDNDGQVTANDVLMILKGLTEDHEADVDGNNIIENTIDAGVAYKTALQPKTVTEGLTLNIYSTGTIQGNINILDTVKLGSSTDEGEKGMQEVNVTTADNVSGVSTIQNAIREAVAAAAINNETVTNQINKIYFNNAVKGTVYLRSENGWAMFCNALRYIVPMDKETAALANKDNYTDYTYYDSSVATAEETARYNALNAAKAVLVGNQTDPSVACDTVLSTDEIKQLAEDFMTAIPSGLTDEEIKLTAQEVLKITDTKYDVNIDYNGTTQTLKSDTIADSQFITDIIAVKDYAVSTVADYRNTFGDVVTFTAQNTTSGGSPITAVIEVAEIAE